MRLVSEGGINSDSILLLSFTVLEGRVNSLQLLSLSVGKAASLNLICWVLKAESKQRLKQDKINDQ